MSETFRDTATADSAAASFHAMGDRVAHNAASGFGGAVVAFPPGGEPIELLLLTGAGDEALFWGTLKAQIEIKLRDLAEQQANSRNGGWR